ncbi:MAG: peptidoglycan-binding protein [Oscillatoriales cyanobacterium]|nr:MAG: peptidoglycan-binding protein [Oscillatoriales cyanobacterium]
MVVLRLPWHRLSNQAAIGIVALAVAVGALWSTPERAEARSPVLRPGQSSSRVAAVQGRLRQLGFFNARRNTGYYGPITMAAVRRYQASRGLPITGSIDSKTLRGLNGVPIARGASPVHIRSSSGGGSAPSSARTVAIQNRLRSLGFFNARSTGHYGPITRQAVQAFQRSRGLTADGVVGPKTRSALFGSSSTPSRSYRVNSGRYGNLSGSIGIGETSARVATLQAKLRTLGYFNSRTNTGYYGPLTRNAVLRYQAANGLPRTGTVSPEMTRRLSGVALSGMRGKP